MKLVNHAIIQITCFFVIGYCVGALVSCDKADWNVMDWPLVGQASFENSDITIDRRVSGDSTAYLLVNWRGLPLTQVAVKINQTCWYGDTDGQTIHYTLATGEDIATRCQDFYLMDLMYNSRTEG